MLANASIVDPVKLVAKAVVNVGDPETVAGKILHVNESLGGISRLTFQMSVAALPHAKMLRAIELLGTRVTPLVRTALASETAAAPLLIDSHAAA